MSYIFHIYIYHIYIYFVYIYIYYIYICAIYCHIIVYPITAIKRDPILTPRSHVANRTGEGCQVGGMLQKCAARAGSQSSDGVYPSAWMPNFPESHHGKTCHVNHPFSSTNSIEANTFWTGWKWLKRQKSLKHLEQIWSVMIHLSAPLSLCSFAAQESLDFVRVEIACQFSLCHFPWWVNCPRSAHADKCMTNIIVGCHPSARSNLQVVQKMSFVRKPQSLCRPSPLCRRALQRLPQWFLA